MLAGRDGKLPPRRREDVVQDWIRQLESRSPAWFVSVSLLTAVVVVFCGGGLGGSPPVVGQTEPLTLTLSAPQICETTPARGASASRLRQNAAGEWTERYDEFLGWFWVATMDVNWTVSGGAGPYRITIDGETRDPAHEYLGASGTASVNCAMTSGAEAFIRGTWRGYREQPDVDSGLKTIPAMVIDATGATAEASVDVYVILELGSAGDRLTAGNTYRVFGGLVTVPEGIDLEILGGIDGDGGETLYMLGIVGASAHILLTERTPHREVFRHVPPAGASGAAGAEIDLHAKLDEFTASVGRPPVALRSTP